MKGCIRCHGPTDQQGDCERCDRERKALGPSDATACSAGEVLERIIEPLPEYQKAIVRGSINPKKRIHKVEQGDMKSQMLYWKHMATMARESLESWAGKQLPTWKHIGELGEIAYMEDGSHRWKVWEGYENMRLFLVYLASGEVQTHFACIRDDGMLCDEHGDDVGWAWYDAEYFMDIPVRPSLPNVPAVAPPTLDSDLPKDVPGG
jgi:hypothetical protein